MNGKGIAIFCDLNLDLNLNLPFPLEMPLNRLSDGISTGKDFPFSIPDRCMTTDPFQLANNIFWIDPGPERQ
jgi:hypothetical protein